MEHSNDLHRRGWLNCLALGSFASWMDHRPLIAEPFHLSAFPLTQGPLNHFFGYYDKFPWDKTGQYVLTHEVNFCDRPPKPGEAITLGYVDRKDNNRFTFLDRTLAWSWQQGAMLQWNPAKPDCEVIYNSVADNTYSTIIRDIRLGSVRTLPKPVHFVRNDGLEAITLDYDRLNRLRPGYGYVALTERAKSESAPETMGASVLDLVTGKSQLVVSLAQLANFLPDDRMRDAHHYINHMQYNPSGKKFLLLHRWTRPSGGGFATRLFVVNRDGTELKLVMDTSLFSHFDWRDDDIILAWTRSQEHGAAFHMIDIQTNTISVFGAGVLARDGHCSFSPDRKWVLNDTYPDKNRNQTLMLIRVADGRRFDLGLFHSPPQFTGAIRCDLHPRFNRDGTQVCFDSTHEHGLRQVYVMNVSDVTRST